MISRISEGNFSLICENVSGIVNESISFLNLGERTTSQLRGHIRKLCQQRLPSSLSLHSDQIAGLVLALINYEEETMFRGNRSFNEPTMNDIVDNVSYLFTVESKIVRKTKDKFKRSHPEPSAPSFGEDSELDSMIPPPELRPNSRGFRSQKPSAPSFGEENEMHSVAVPPPEYHSGSFRGQRSQQQQIYRQPPMQRDRITGRKRGRKEDENLSFDRPLVPPTKKVKREESERDECEKLGVKYLNDVPLQNDFSSINQLRLGNFSKEEKNKVIKTCILRIGDRIRHIVNDNNHENHRLTRTNFEMKLWEYIDSRIMVGEKSKSIRFYFQEFDRLRNAQSLMNQKRHKMEVRKQKNDFSFPPSQQQQQQLNIRLQPHSHGFDVRVDGASFPNVQKYNHPPQNEYYPTNQPKEITPPSYYVGDYADENIRRRRRRSSSGEGNFDEYLQHRPYTRVPNNDNNPQMKRRKWRRDSVIMEAGDEGFRVTGRFAMTCLMFSFFIIFLLYIIM